MNIYKHPFLIFNCQLSYAFVLSTMRSKHVLTILWVIGLLLFVQCASEAPPGGGPPDKTPPALININIASGSTRIPSDLEILFYFSENLNPDNIKKNVTIFPLSDNIATVRVKGKNLSIKPVTTWDPGIVYTLIVGKGVSDIRGNTLEQPIQISFTSGDEIPKNRISGKVLNLRSGTTAVISLSRNTAVPDSVILYPEYYTQTGPAGDFMFEYLPAEIFNIAGYVDMDKSNSYKDKFDGVCVPLKQALLPDTAFSPIPVEAVYENFLPGFIINAESVDPSKTVLTFSKDPAPWNKRSGFTIAGESVDSVEIKDAVCNVYHRELGTDTLTISLKGLVDMVNVPIADTLLQVPVTAWADSFFHFEQAAHLLRITPDPRAEELSGSFQSNSDTLDMTISRHMTGFYSLPKFKAGKKGTFLLRFPYVRENIISDSTYSAPLNIPPLPEYGSVLGLLEANEISGLHMVLKNDKKNYDINVSDLAFSFNRVLPGTYSLSYYFDMNGNDRRDSGRPYPHQKPEFLYLLDQNIDVRARWDTELEEAYKIVVENDK